MGKVGAYLYSSLDIVYNISKFLELFLQLKEILSSVYYVGYIFLDKFCTDLR